LLLNRLCESLTKGAHNRYLGFGLLKLATQHSS